MAVKEKQLKKQIISSSRRLLSANNLIKEGSYRNEAVKNEAMKNEQYFLYRKIERFQTDSTANIDLTEDSLSKKVQERLYTDEAMLEYCFSDSSLFLFVLTRDTLAVFRLPGGKEMHQKIRTFASSLKNADIKESVQLGKELYRYLILPAADLISLKNHLIIIPDEELSQIPFEALIKNNAYPYTYLLLDHEISYHFSASLWHETVSNSESRTDTLSFCGFAPVNFNNSGPSNFNPLPESRNEVTQIAEMFKNKGLKSEVFLYGDATERSFQIAADSFACLHLASHSITDKYHPENSGILFYADSLAAISGDDEILYMDEIENLSLHNCLVVLSACATGKGILTRTEGMLALSRGFIMAGSQNLLWSLWNVRDNYTKTFMICFYNEVLSGKGFPSAVRNAKLNMISKPETALPLLWAGFVITGR